MHAQLSSGPRGLNFSPSLHRLPYMVYTSREGFVEQACLSLTCSPMPCVDRVNSVRELLKTFFWSSTYFTEGSMDLSRPKGSNCFSRKVHTSISKDSYSNVATYDFSGSGGPDPRVPPLDPPMYALTFFCFDG